MLLSQDYIAIGVTLKLAFWTTLILLALGTPVAWWLARSNSKPKAIIEALIALPLILPPTVLGFYLLLLMGKQGPLAYFYDAFDLQPLAFSFWGLVIGSVIYSMPFVIQPLQTAFRGIDRRYLEVAASLGAAPLDRFFNIILPLAKSGFLTATVLGFAHTVGEFGVVLMIGGNIPGQTQVLSIAIYDHVESLEYARAHYLAGGLLLTSFLMLLGVYLLNRRSQLVNL